MKKNLFLLFFFFPLNKVFCQIQEFINEYKIVDINTQSIKKFKNNKIYTSKIYWQFKGSEDYKYVNSSAESLVDILINYEKSTLYYNTISFKTSKSIEYVNNPYILLLLIKALKNYEFHTTTNISKTDFEYFRTKILTILNPKLTRLNSQNFPHYSYESSKKKGLKFFYINHGNDLLDPFQPNLDNEYTGSFDIEFATDYLNPSRKKPIKSYQTLIFGLDVYTPYFRDDSIFTKPSSYNKTDRPFAAFQYIGWGRYVLSKSDKWRWNYKVKLGTIGGKGGEIFQSILHQDVTSSPEPLGWGAQISNGGRLAISLENKIEREINSEGKSFFIQPYVEGRWGSYITSAGLGLNISNRSFKENNHHGINHRTKENIEFLLQHFKWNFSFKSTRVFHNSMLEGFGFLKTHELDSLSKYGKSRPASVYYLNRNKGDKQVNRQTYATNFGLSYTMTFATISYNWTSYSPETNLSRTVIHPEKNFSLNRWHNVGEIAISFNLK